jgi:serine/threonine protein kinase
VLTPVTQKEALMPVAENSLRPEERSVTGPVTGALRKYCVLAELGQGGMAVVHLALAKGHSGFNKLVVLKRLHDRLARDPQFLEMFIEEARLAARLNHPNVVQTYEVEREGTNHVIVMEYLEGEPLSRVLLQQFDRAKKPLPLGLHLRVLADAASGLHYAHELCNFDGTPLSLVHRDFTPHNIFVTFEGQVKVLDFGVAKAVTSGGDTGTGVLKGKIAYMAPEQMGGENLDRRADIFALGVMLWEAATGERLWKAQTEVAIMNRVMNAEIPSPRSVNPSVPERLEQIVMKALSFEKEQRYATAAEVEQEILALLEGMSERATNRELGRFVSKLFEETRAETKALIESQVAKAQNLDSSEFGTLERVRVPSSAPPPGSLGTGASHMKSKRTEPPPKTKRNLAIVVALLAALGGVAVFAANRWHVVQNVPRPVAESTPAIMQGPAPPASVAQAPEPKEVMIELGASPAGAKILFDGEPLPSNPAERRFTADGSHHEVKASAPGFIDKTVDVVLDSNQKVYLALEHAPNPALGARHPHAQGQASPRSSAAPPPAKADCSSPFYFDKDGIKRIKAECM